LLGLEGGRGEGDTKSKAAEPSREERGRIDSSADGETEKKEKGSFKMLEGIEPGDKTGKRNILFCPYGIRDTKAAFKEKENSL